MHSIPSTVQSRAECSCARGGRKDRVDRDGDQHMMLHANAHQHRTSAATIDMSRLSAGLALACIVVAAFLLRYRVWLIDGGLEAYYGPGPTFSTTATFRSGIFAPLRRSSMVIGTCSDHIRRAIRHFSLSFICWAYTIHNKSGWSKDSSTQVPASCATSFCAN